MKSKRADRLGEKGLNQGIWPMEIIEYRNNKDITVYFPATKETVHTRYEHFRRGTVPCKVTFAQAMNKVKKRVIVGSIIASVVTLGVVAACILL